VSSAVDGMRIGKAIAREIRGEGAESVRLENVETEVALV
jgi:hypothetical protein